jgi:hypothetical protein
MDAPLTTERAGRGLHMRIEPPPAEGAHHPLPLRDAQIA